MNNGNEITEEIEIGKLYERLLADGNKIVTYGDNYELLDASSLGIKVHTIGNNYKLIKFLSRHKTNKHILKITINDGKTIKVTTDHICMIYNKNHFLENINAKYLSINDSVVIYSKENNKEFNGSIISINDLGIQDEYVYDLEVDDDMHCFYGNDILIHNSQFINLSCLVDKFKIDNKISGKLGDWSNEDKLKLWKFVDGFVENTLNPYVQKLITDTCHTSNAAVLRYSLEYVGDSGIYEQKKRYCVHKIIAEGPDIVNKIKYSGIELKKRVVPKEMKSILGEIYDNVLLGRWNEKDYLDYINSTYTKFIKMPITSVSLWKGYGTERESTGFLQMAKGATGISKACNYYNDLIKKLGLSHEYSDLRVGDMCRFCYVDPSNQYGIECIAFKDGQWPKEFDSIFKVDYPKMFDKVLLSSLKSFLNATKFHEADPRKQVSFDISNL